MCYSDDQIMNHGNGNHGNADHGDTRMSSTRQYPLTPLKRSTYEIAVSPLLFKGISVLTFVTGGVMGLATLLFSLWFPFVLTPVAASRTYIPAFYKYDAVNSFFCNDIWTYGTDYALTVAMSVLAYRCFTASSSRATRKLRVLSAGLLLCYAVSVTAGGWAHQFYLTLEHRNSIAFRILWTICVGTVTAAGGFMGACASEMASKFLSLRTPDSFWVGFGASTTLVCILGGISFQRPACDIFVAGTTQAFPTFFLMGIVACTMGSKDQITNSYRMVSLVGFILNAPLLPMYSLLIQHTDWTLASVNTLLHSWLFVAWSMQALSLRHFILAIPDDKKIQ